MTPIIWLFVLMHYCFVRKGGVHTYWPAKKCAGDVCNLRLAMFTDRLLNIPIIKFSLRISKSSYFPKTSHSKQPFVLVKVFHQFSWRPLGNIAMGNHPELVNHLDIRDLINSRCFSDLTENHPELVKCSLSNLQQRQNPPGDHPPRNHMESPAGPRILQRLVVLRLRDHLVEEDGALAPEDSALAPNQWPFQEPIYWR